MTKRGKRRLVIFLCAVVILVTVGILSSCSSWDVPEYMTEAELLNYMKEQYGVDFVICDMEERGESPSTLMSRDYLMHPKDDEDLLVTVSETIKKLPKLFPTDRTYSHVIYDTYIGSLFQQRLLAFCDENGIECKKAPDGLLTTIYLQEEQLEQQIRDICAFGEGLNDESPYDTKGGTSDPTGGVAFRCRDYEVEIIPFQHKEEPPYIEMNADEIIGFFIGSEFVDALSDFLADKEINCKKGLDNTLFIDFEYYGLANQVEDICAFCESLNQEQPFNTEAASYAQATIVFQYARYGFEINYGQTDVDINPFQAQAPYIVMEADSIIHSLKE